MMRTPTHSSFLSPILMFLGGTAAFVAIALDVTHHGKLWEVDGMIAPYLHQHGYYWLVFLAAGFSGLGQFWFLAPVGVGAGVYFIRRREWRILATWATGLVGSSVICGALKSYYGVPRPARYTWYSFLEDHGYSFPSGHTMGVMITSGLVALVWMRWRPRSAGRRWAAAGLAGLVGMLTASSLLYLGVHYLTDVLGGLAVSVAWLGVLRWMLPPAVPGAYDEGHAGRSFPVSATTLSGETPHARTDPVDSPVLPVPPSRGTDQIDRAANP